MMRQRHAPRYQVCSLETDQKDLPLIEFSDVGLDCQMIVLSAHTAKLLITSIKNPFAGLITKVGRPLKIQAIEYVISAEKRNGNWASQVYRHAFTIPASLNDTLIESRPHKLFELGTLDLLLSSRAFSAKEFKGIKAIQFIA